MFHMSYGTYHVLHLTCHNLFNDLLPNPRGAGLHLAFQFSYVRMDRQSERPRLVHLLRSNFGPYTLAWTKNPNLCVGWSLMVANDVFILRECFAKISEFFKRNWAGQHIFSLQWDLQWQKSPKT